MHKINMSKTTYGEKRSASICVRYELVQAALDQAAEEYVRPDKITYLARYVAKYVAVGELKFISENTDQDMIAEPVKKCNFRSLLKSPTYRLMLESWMDAYCRESSRQDVKAVRRLEYDLLVLSNRFAKLEADYLDEVSNNDSKRTDQTLTLHTKLQSASEDGFAMADTLLRYFKEFCIVENDRLVERSPARPVIVPSHIFSSYLEWRSRKL